MTQENKQYNIKEISPNPFESRGCCSTPKAYVSKGIYKKSCAKLRAYDRTGGITDYHDEEYEVFEISFKNERKDFFKASFAINLEEGDFVVVETGSSGYDIGIISLKGIAARKQMRHKNRKDPVEQLKSIYRRATPEDIEKWIEAVNKEYSTYKQTKIITREMDLEMKINDIEYQGDGTKATFYYTAEDRVDFRKLIKVLASTFHVRVEMKQIGARQEAAKLGGIGPCGRELCCSSWMSSFSSISTSYIRTQQLSPNPQKLAGLCGKLKCCLKFENDMYEEALKEFPDSKTILKTRKGIAKQLKIDVFQHKIWYNYTEKDNIPTVIAVSLDDVKKIINMNAKGEYPDTLHTFAIKDKSDLLDGNDLSIEDRFQETFL